MTKIAIADATDESEENRIYKWEITPHPDSNDYDFMVTDDDNEALAAILRVAEMHLWDAAEPGEERIVKVKLNEN